MLPTRRTTTRRKMPAQTSTTYDKDFLTWTEEQAALLRAGNFAEADIGHIIEEIEEMGREQKDQAPVSATANSRAFAQARSFTIPQSSPRVD